MNSKTTDHKKIGGDIEKFIIDDNHPCLMAQSVILNNSYKMLILENSSLREVHKLYKFLEEHVAKEKRPANSFYSTIAVFPNNNVSNSLEFEDFLWNILYKLNSMDTYDWDPSVSKHLNDNNYSFSIVGRAFYIVGMHPNSSRKARQMPYATLVFNLHSQFEKLREMGAYNQVRNRIRNRDIKLQGTINPMLKDFGQESEAKQYSGRKVEKNWECPYFKDEIK